MLCLVTGATGYVGGRLVPRLLAEGHSVRCLVRSPDKLRDVPWGGQVEVICGDVLDVASMREACAGVEVLYYLVHSLTESGFATLDRQAALRTAQAARETGVGRIVYLGGPHPDEDGRGLSAHLGSRAEVGEIFLRSGVPTAVLQAAVIIGSGSASFEMLRHLTERLPIMVTPRWVSNRVQPIAIRDVMHYLLGVAWLPAGCNRSFDIGGPDVLSYGEMMQRYAAICDLPRRIMLPVGVLTPWLSSQWINIITPVPKAIGAPLIQSLDHEAVCREHDIVEYVPDPPDGLTGYDRAVTLALARISRAEVETRWSDASLPDAASDPLPTDPSWAGNSAYTDVRSQHTSATPEQLWRVVTGIGGEHGWYSAPLAWSLRGFADRLIGGVGLRRGRRDPQQLQVGEALDWWRVEELSGQPPTRLLRLRAEMKLPGQAWLELTVSQGDGDGATYRQRAVFIPHGLAGHAYWWALIPFHGAIFGGMAANITDAAERGAAAGATPRPKRAHGRA